MNRPHGRGSGSNPGNRFETLERVKDETEEAETGAIRTEVIDDASRNIIATNDSPDVGFGASINPYRGCEHGCIYCYARPTHEYLGYSAGLDFESKIVVKREAPALLREALASPKWTSQVIAVSGVTDAYQPVERRLRIARDCLAVLAEFRNPVAIVTKNFLVTRDLDHLLELHRYRAVAVMISVTTLRPELARVMEPRASRPEKRLEAIRVLAQAGIPVGVNVAPVIPGLTDEEIPAIVAAAGEAGAAFAHMIPVRLPHGVKDLFADWLEAHMPARRGKVLNRIRAMRGDRLNDARFGERMRGSGLFAEQMEGLFQAAVRKAGMAGRMPALSTADFRRPQGQLALL